LILLEEEEVLTALWTGSDSVLSRARKAILIHFEGVRPAGSPTLEEVRHNFLLSNTPFYRFKSLSPPSPDLISNLHPSWPRHLSPGRGISALAAVSQPWKVQPLALSQPVLCLRLCQQMWKDVSHLIKKIDVP
jgi:hypothetical protein